MSADRELLELAAKAAGLSLMKWWEAMDTFVIAEGERMGEWWNPLESDGDALRLAADLRLEIKPGKHVGDGCTVESQRPGIAGHTAFYDDKAQQMRRAIVGVAAEIGKAMP